MLCNEELQTDPYRQFCGKNIISYRVSAFVMLRNTILYFVHLVSYARPFNLDVFALLSCFVSVVQLIFSFIQCNLALCVTLLAARQYFYMLNSTLVAQTTGFCKYLPHNTRLFDQKLPAYQDFIFTRRDLNYVLTSLAHQKTPHWIQSGVVSTSSPCLSLRTNHIDIFVTV